MQAVLKTQLRCDVINSLPSPKPERGKSCHQHVHQRRHGLLFLTLILSWLPRSVYSTPGGREESLPRGWVIVESTTEGSFSPSLLPPPPLLSPPLLSISLSTMAITQFRLLPTLAHTLSWKEREYHYVFFLRKQDKATSDKSTLAEQERSNGKNADCVTSSNPPTRLARSGNIRNLFSLNKAKCKC